MARHGVMHQKIEKHKRYMAKHRFENTAHLYIGDVRLARGREYHEEIITEVTISNNAGFSEVTEEIRRHTLTDHAVTPKDEVRRIVKWGKRYYGVYHGAELVRLIPADNAGTIIRKR